MNLSNNDYGFEPEQAQQKTDYGFEPEELESRKLKARENSPFQKSASLTAHALGAVVALPGNVLDLAYQGNEQAKKLTMYMADKMGLSFDADFLKNDSIKNYEESNKSPFNFIRDFFPSSQDVNKFIDESSGGYFAPKSEGQKFANDMAEDVVNSVLNKSPKTLTRNFIIPAAANIIRKGAELFGVDPSNAEVLKMLTWIGADMASIANTRDMLSNRFEQTKRLAPRSDMINANPRDMRFLDLLEQDLKSGGTRPSTQAALTKVTEMRNIMQTGQIPARQTLDFYRAINELKTNLKAFAVEGASKPEHVFRLNQVQKLTNNMLDRYGKNQNPRFLKSFRENNLAWSAMEQSNNVASFVRKNYTKPLVSDAAKGIFANTTGTGLAVAGGLVGLERLQAFVRRLENPILRQYYGQVLRFSLENNAPAMIKSLNNFDKTAKQMEDKGDQ